MADSELKECPCSNITIMQLFHELKQKYPKIPDQVVSKVIEQNSHDKTACETILERESPHYLQSYPGSIISGNVRDPTEPLCKHCTAPRLPQPERSPPRNEVPQPSSAFWKRLHESRRKSTRQQDGSEQCGNEVNACSEDKLTHSEAECAEDEVPINQKGLRRVKDGKEELSGGERDPALNSSSSSLGTYLESVTEEDEQKDRADLSSESSAVITDRTSESGCDSESKEDNFLRSHSFVESSSPRMPREIETCRWSVEDGGRKSAVVSGIISHLSSSEPPSTHNYQVAVECSLQQIPFDGQLNRDQTRSFTSVSLCLRPPSSEPQSLIEIQSGQSLTYTTSSYDPKKGYQSQLQIRIDPGGGSTFSACRTYISTPQFKFSSSKTSNCTYHFPSSHRCQSKQHLKELLKKQKERKDLLARELRREREKLRYMKNEVRLMEAAIAQRPNPQILPQLKADILRLRAECERLTTAVDMYSDNQSNLPLGETNEEFYRNIYTGQRFQREGSWSCQLCTFRNHPLLSICEECEMPRLSLGAVNSWVV
ncbi:UNVERIFIED_CONTAM: hypothetical protein PYX00_003215 [Menopon gallinae]|uniref:RanBP2-type domain-containing protein n=1 Tax=Menopon gallinae TaxID=328185 RepID=A0AAW2I0A0_9NEOP